MSDTTEINVIRDVVHGEAPWTALGHIGVEFSVTKSERETVISTKNPKHLGVKVESIDIARGLLRALEESGNDSDALRDWATAVYHCSCFEFDIPEDEHLSWMELIDALFSASVNGRVSASSVELAKRIASQN